MDAPRGRGYQVKPSSNAQGILCMFHREELEQLKMVNPWKKWNEKLGFKKVAQQPPPSESEINPAPTEHSENAPLLVIGNTSSTPDLLTGNEIEPAHLIPPQRERVTSNNPFDNQIEMPVAPPAQFPRPAQAPYYTVRFTGGGVAPSIQLPPMPPGYGYGPPGGYGVQPQNGEIAGADQNKDKKDVVVDIPEEKAEEEEPVRKSPVKDQPFFLTMLFAVTILVLFMHLPVGIMIGNYMRSVSTVILVGPAGAVVGLLAVYITPCECVASRQQAIDRIRYLAMVSLIMDAIGALVMPMAVYSMECPGRDGEPYNNSCQFMRIPAQGVALAAGIVTGIHLFLMFAVRSGADKLSQLVSEFPDDVEEESDDSDSDSDTDSEDEREKERERKRKEKEKEKKKKEKEKEKKSKKAKKGKK